MRPVLRPLLVLHPDPVFCEQVRRAGGKRFDYQRVYSWSQLRELARTAPPAALAVVDPYGRDGDLSSEMRAFLMEFPSVAVLAGVELRPERFRDLRTLGAWGVADVIALREEDTPTAIGRRLHSLDGRPLKALLERALPESMPGHARSLLAVSAEVVSTGGQAQELARALHLSPRTLLRWCERAELPPPRRLLAWMRILLAAELLDDPGRTVQSVAHACGYSSDNSLRRALQDFLGATPSVLRREGAFAIASQALLQELSGIRHGGAHRLSGSGRS